MNSIEIVYKLNLSDATKARHPSGAPLTTTVSVPITLTTNPPSTREYYAALGDAVRRATRDFGGDITAWRDAVGDDEREKEQKAKKDAAAIAAANPDTVDEDGEDEDV